MCSNDASLAAAVDVLAAVDVTGLPIGGLQELVADLAGASNRLAGVLSRAVGELAVR
ncbi:MAG: hypothetical protein JWP11_956, partial [Frankiales bacterium]|nr:hypothetical protein [Frankiales bacterium]